MRQVILLVGFVVSVAAGPAAQAINFSSVDAAPAPAFTGPPADVNTQTIPYNSASVASAGSAAATAAATASATALVSNKVKRTFWWPWSPPVSKPQPSSDPKPPPQPTPAPVKPTTTSSAINTGSATTSSDSSCPTTPEEGTYCGFINPEDACAPQPDGYGTQVQPDTADAFLAFPEFHKTAQNAQAPKGYTTTFKDLNATVNANTYLGLHTLKSYDISGCGSQCDSTDLCTAFNIYFERDPALNPSDDCTKPDSITNIKCTLWGSGVNAASAVNFGQYCRDFQVVIAGSNGYEKTNTTTPDSCPGWQPPKKCGGDGSKGHDHPSTCIGKSFFPGPFNPAICAAFAEAQNALNAKQAWWQKWISIFSGKNYNPGKCTFFNSYMLKKNGKGLGTHCSLFAQHFDGGAATYQPGWQGKDFWNIESSWSYDIEGSW